VVYLAAGALIFPLVKDFYASKAMPSLGQLFVTQLLRGQLYVAIVIPLIRRMSGRRREAAVVIGSCFAVLGGLAPLLYSNDFMPASIRLVHAVEAGVSNFLYGVIVAYLLVTYTREQQSPTRPESAPIVV